MNFLSKDKTKMCDENYMNMEYIYIYKRKYNILFFE
jgi:hypothetical protein